MSKFLKTSYSPHHRIETFFTGNQIAFDNQGEHFYCSYGPLINKVSVIDGQVKGQIKPSSEDDNVIRFALSPDNHLVVIAYASGIIVKFNLIDEAIEREFRSIHSAPISFLKINPTNSLLATASSDGAIKLWNLKNHYCSHNLKGINGVVSCIEFYESERLNMLVCASGDDKIHLFDLESSKRLRKLSNHGSTITDVKISPDASQMISVGRDKIAVVWNLNPSDEAFGQAVRTIPLYESVESLVILNLGVFKDYLTSSMDLDQLIFATIGEEGLIKFWDTKTGARVFTQNGAPLSMDRCPGHPCVQLCQRPSSDQLCAVSLERDLFFYDLPLLTLNQQLQGHIDEILSACWFAHDQYVALACNSNDLKVVDVQTSKCQHLKGHSDIVLCVRPITREPMCLVSSSKDCNIIIWRFDKETMSPSIIYRGTGHTHAVHALESLNGELALLSGGEDTTLKRWNFSLKSDHILEPNLPLIASDTIKAHNDRIDSIAISPNDQLVATGSRDKTSKIFSATNLQLLATLKGHRRGINSVKFSPVDQVIITAGDTTLRMWNLNNFACVKTFQGHECQVLDFSFLSNGLQLLSVGSDGNMKLWNCKTNESSKTIDAHSGICWVLSMTKDDKYVVTGGQDEKLVIWKDTTKDEQEQRLLNLQTQVLQEQDFMNYVNKKKWKRALKLAIKLENPTKALSVFREIMLEPNATDQLCRILEYRPNDEVDFVVGCCSNWASSAKTSSIAQQVINVILRNYDQETLLKIPSMTKNLDQMMDLTQKACNRCERLVQEATFVDFFMRTMRIV